MAFKKIIKKKEFWRLVVFQGLAFAVIYQVITMLFEYGGFAFSELYQDKLANGRWIRFVGGTVIAAFLYGFIITYGQFKTRIKKENTDY